MRKRSSRCRLVGLAAPAFMVLLLTSCANESVNPRISDQQLPLESLLEVESTLEEKIGAAVRSKDADLIVDVNLLLANYIDTNQFRNTFNVTNPSKGLQATRHEFFLLSDNPFPRNSGRSVLRAYEAIAESANCLSNDLTEYPGCILLQGAKTDLQAPKMPPSLFRQGWPEWRPVGANPENWAESSTLWTSVHFDAGDFLVQTDYLYVTVRRGWLSEDFLASDGWYVNGKCSGFISDGKPDNNTSSAEKEFLSQIPVGLLLTRNLTISSNHQVVLRLVSPYLTGWAYRLVPYSPKCSDPSYRAKCRNEGASERLCTSAVGQL